MHYVRGIIYVSMCIIHVCVQRGHFSGAAVVLRRGFDSLGEDCACCDAVAAETIL